MKLYEVVVFCSEYRHRIWRILWWKFEAPFEALPLIFASVGGLKDVLKTHRNHCVYFSLPSCWSYLTLEYSWWVPRISTITQLGWKPPQFSTAFPKEPLPAPSVVAGPCSGKWRCIWRSRCWRCNFKVGSKQISTNLETWRKPKTHKEIKPSILQLATPKTTDPVMGEC